MTFLLRHIPHNSDLDSKPHFSPLPSLVKVSITNFFDLCLSEHEMLTVCLCQSATTEWNSIIQNTVIIHTHSNTLSNLRILIMSRSYFRQVKSNFIIFEPTLSQHFHTTVSVSNRWIVTKTHDPPYLLGIRLVLACFFEMVLLGQKPKRNHKHEEQTLNRIPFFPLYLKSMLHEAVILFVCIPNLIYHEHVNMM